MMASNSLLAALEQNVACNYCNRKCYHGHGYSLKETDQSYACMHVREVLLKYLRSVGLYPSLALGTLPFVIGCGIVNGPFGVRLEMRKGECAKGLGCLRVAEEDTWRICAAGVLLEPMEGCRGDTIYTVYSTLSIL